MWTWRTESDPSGRVGLQWGSRVGTSSTSPQMELQHLISPDIDECTLPTACPLGICTNTNGSFTCQACDAGYTLSSHRHACEGKWPPLHSAFSTPTSNVCRSGRSECSVRSSFWQSCPSLHLLSCTLYCLLRDGLHHHL